MLLQSILAKFLKLGILYIFYKLENLAKNWQSSLHRKPEHERT